MLGFWSVMRRKGPVFTGLKDNKGYQPPVSFALPGWLKKAFAYAGIASAMQPEYIDEGKQTVFSGPIGDGVQPRISFYKLKLEQQAEKKPQPTAPPTRPGSTFPGYALDREHAFSY